MCIVGGSGIRFHERTGNTPTRIPAGLPSRILCDVCLLVCRPAADARGPVDFEGGNVDPFGTPYYGHRREWALPGGGRRRSEDPVVCARRELKEELGISGEFIEIGTLELFHDYRHDAVTIFVVTDLSNTPQSDGIEIVQAQWFRTDHLPANLTPLAFNVLRSVGSTLG
jgi:ADP-ribose pyrophosphatase YjhB (NUDIX family)